MMVYGKPPNPQVGFLTWLRSFFAWQNFKELGIWLYQENAVTHQRRAIKLSSSLCGPAHWQWLDGGAWEVKRPAPPRGSSAVRMPTAQAESA